MDYRDSFSAMLPPSRDDEPLGLRQDIIDELSDHLACAHNRELLRGADSKRAQQRVLARFGDPAAVARRLWFDAMKGKIMIQRVLIGSCVVMTLASLSLAGFVMRQSTLVQRERAIAEAAALRAMTARNELTQRTQEEMLKQMREMSEVVRSNHSLEWNPVTFKLTEDTPDGPPAAGASIALAERVPAAGAGQFGGMGGGPGISKPTWRVTDISGLADFGFVRPGEYAYQVYKSSDQGYITTSGELSIEPGTKAGKHLICPKTPFERVPVRLRWNWPADLEKQNLVLYATFNHEPIKLLGMSWALSDDLLPEAAQSRRFMFGFQFMAPMNRSVLCGPASNNIALLLPKKFPLFWTLSAWNHNPILADFLRADVGETLPPGETLHWERGTYRLCSAFVLRASHRREGDAVQRRFEIVVASQMLPPMLNTRYQVLVSPPSYDDIPAPHAKGVGTNARNGMGGGMGPPTFQLANNGPDLFPSEAWSLTGMSFEALPGQINEYTIPITDDLIKAVREKLKAKPNAGTQ